MTHNAISFPQDQQDKYLSLTPPPKDWESMCEDILVIGKREIAQLIKWRNKVLHVQRKSKEQEKKNKVKSITTDGVENEEEDVEDVDEDSMDVEDDEDEWVDEKAHDDEEEGDEDEDEEDDEEEEEENEEDVDDNLASELRDNQKKELNKQRKKKEKLLKGISKKAIGL